MARNGQVLEPVEQEVVPFHEHEIIAVRLADGRICVVLRWVCETLRLDSQGQVQRIERTASTANELVRVRVQPRVVGSKGGGIQTMPALTLRGFSPWILGINPEEVKSGDLAEEARIRELIVAYQEEAKDVLYQHFLNKGRPVLPEPRAIIIQPMEEPSPEANHEEQANYHETMSLWHRWQADYHNQEWLKSIQQQQVALIEEDQAMGNLLANVQKRLGPETISRGHQEDVQEYVNAWSKATGKNRGIIYTDLHARFRVPRYQELLEADWPAIKEFFRRRFPGGVLPVIQQSLFDTSEDTES
jgi:P22_AR N-terminal domain